MSDEQYKAAQAAAHEDSVCNSVLRKAEEENRRRCEAARVERLAAVVMPEDSAPGSEEAPEEALALDRARALLLRYGWRNRFMLDIWFPPLRVAQIPHIVLNSQKIRVGCYLDRWFVQWLDNTPEISGSLEDLAGLEAVLMGVEIGS